MELLIFLNFFFLVFFSFLDSGTFIQTKIRFSKSHDVDPHFTSAAFHCVLKRYMHLSVHLFVRVCVFLFLCVCVCVSVCVWLCHQKKGGLARRWGGGGVGGNGVSVRFHASVHSLWVSATMLQPCSCVPRVDVPKWGHFLSVWCLRNNPTAQKLLQPSASTYLFLYLYWSGCLTIVLLHAVWVSACSDTDHARCLVPALLLTIWGFYTHSQSVKSWHCTDRKKRLFKISHLGSNVCVNVTFG